jgi:arylsulfatase A-like enzyme
MVRLKNMKRRDFAKVALAGTALGLLKSEALPKEPTLVPTSRNKEKRPNLIYIFPDQFRLQSLGIWQQKGFDNILGTVSDPVVTPTLDRLAKESILFSQACTIYPLCSPYRGMLMSGRYPANNGIENNCRADRADSLRHDISCMTDVLHDSGYETAYIGKAHWEETRNLFDESGNYIGIRKAPGGHLMNRYDTYVPEGRGRHGNDYWFQCVKDDHKDPRVYSSDPEAIEGKRDGEQYRPGIYSPKLEADVIIDYLRNTRNQRDSGKPFSLVWAPNPPHNPYASEDDCDEVAYRKFYRDKKPANLLNRPNLVDNPENKAKQVAAFYFANVTGIDKQVNRVLQALEEIGEAGNTILVFTSDHGEMMGSHGLMGKNCIYDEAFLVPCMIRFPGRLEHRIEDLMLTPVDMMPTLLGLLGLSDEIPGKLDGVNYARALENNRFDHTPKPRNVPYIGFKKRGIRSADYTVEVHEDGTTRFFDLRADPYQRKSLAPDERPAAMQKNLLKDLGAWLVKMNDPWFHEKVQDVIIPYPRPLS